MIVMMQNPDSLPFVMAGSSPESLDDESLQSEDRLPFSVMVSHDVGRWLQSARPSKVSVWILEHPGDPFPHLETRAGTITIDPNDNGWGMDISTPSSTSNVWQLQVTTPLDKSLDGGASIN